MTTKEAIDELVRRAETAEAQVKEALAACKLAVETIDGLSDQQAMPDDWYLFNRKRILTTIANIEEQKE